MDGHGHREHSFARCLEEQLVCLDGVSQRPAIPQEVQSSVYLFGHKVRLLIKTLMCPVFAPTAGPALSSPPRDEASLELMHPHCACAFCKSYVVETRIHSRIRVRSKSTLP